MSIRSLGKNKWQIDYYPNGRKGRRIRKTYYGSIEETQELEQELRQINLHESHIPTNATIAYLFPQFLDWYELHRAKSSYIDIESVYRNHLKKYFGVFMAEDISLQHINVYKRIRKTEKGTNRTITKELNYFSGFLRWCERQGYITQRQFRIEKLPYTRPIPIVLSFDEVMRLIASAEPFYQSFFLCLYSLGLRFSEAQKLKVEDIDIANKLVKVRQKGGKYKILPFNSWLLNTLINIMPKKGYVFLSARTGEPITDIRKALYRACKRAGITKKVYPHLLRHSFATHLLGLNINLRTIQQYLGHSQISTTEFYTHVALEHLRDAGDKLFIDYSKPLTNKNIDYT